MWRYLICLLLLPQILLANRTPKPKGSVGEVLSNFRKDFERFKKELGSYKEHWSEEGLIHFYFGEIKLQDKAYGSTFEEIQGKLSKTSSPKVIAEILETSFADKINKEGYIPLSGGLHTTKGLNYFEYLNALIGKPIFGEDRPIEKRINWTKIPFVGHSAYFLSRYTDDQRHLFAPERPPGKQTESNTVEFFRKESGLLTARLGSNLAAKRNKLKTIWPAFSEAGAARACAEIVATNNFPKYDSDNPLQIKYCRKWETNWFFSIFDSDSLKKLVEFQVEEPTKKEIIFRAIDSVIINPLDSQGPRYSHSGINKILDLFQDQIANDPWDLLKKIKLVAPEKRDWQFHNYSSKLEPMNPFLQLKRCESFGTTKIFYAYAEESISSTCPKLKTCFGTD